MSSVGAGRDESGQMFNQMLNRNAQNYQQAFGANQANFDQMMRSSGYANQIRQQQMAEAMQKRGFSLNEINALLSGQQVGLPQMPGFNQAQSAVPAPYYQGQADQTSMENASSPWNSLIGMAGSVMGGWLGGQ